MKNYIFLVGFINSNGCFEMERRTTKAANVKEAWFIITKVACYKHGDKLERVIFLKMADEVEEEHYNDDSEEEEYE